MKKPHIKILTALMSLTLSTAGLAAVDVPNLCNYSDYYHLADGAPAGLHISDYMNDENITFVLKDSISFYLKDTPACPLNGGYAKVHYGIDSENYCDLTLHDGAGIWNPEVVASCKGTVKFSSMKYDGVGTYSYSLIFTN